MRRYPALVAVQPACDFIMLLAKKPFGKAKKLVLGSATLKLKPNRAGKTRLRQGGSSVSVQVGGGGRFVTRKVKIVR